MREAKFFQVGEEIYIKSTVTGVKITQEGFEYHIKNPETGRPFPFTFHEDQIFPTDGGSDGKN